VAELAEHEVPEGKDSRGNPANAVFFLQASSASQAPLWLGPEPRQSFIRTIKQAHLQPGSPQSLRIENAGIFRVVVQPGSHGDVYLGLSDREATARLHELTLRFLLAWGLVALFGFFISYLSTRRTLARVEEITETVASIGSEDLSARLPEPSNSDEISRLALTFNHMLGRIQSSVNQLRSVTDAVAHDLKSPLTFIRGRLEAVLLDGENTSNSDAIGEAIEAVDRLSHLINTTLDLAEAEAGALKLQRTSIDLRAAVRKLADLYRPVMADRAQQLLLHLGPGVMVEGDSALLNRVLSNLLENELIHTPEGTAISISVAAREDFAEVVIEDTGPGFPADIGARAFERFVKGQHSPGHGLGLAFVDAVVQAHGGSVKISDREGGGAIIALTFPLPVLQPA
jgi:signal transduction histidine kinase